MRGLAWNDANTNASANRIGAEQDRATARDRKEGKKAKDGSGG